MDRLILLFEYIALTECCSSENTPFRLEDFL